MFQCQFKFFYIEGNEILSMNIFRVKLTRVIFLIGFRIIYGKDFFEIIQDYTKIYAA